MNDLNQESEQNNKSNSGKTGVEVTDSNFESEVLQSNKPFILHFSLESEYDSKIVPILDELFQQYSKTVKFGKINMSEHTSTTSKYGVSMAPTLLIFVKGKVVAQIIGAVGKDIISTKLEMVLEKPSEELQELSLSELKKAYKPYTKTGEWSHAFVSGLVSGVVFAIARSHLEGGIAFLVPAFAYAFFIQNKNLGFSWLQKIFATGLMFVVGMYWREILLLMK